MPAYHRLGRRWQINHWNTPQALQPFPQVTLDTTHLGAWGLDPVQVYPQIKKRVAHIHLRNYNGEEHRLPNKGHLRLDKF